MADKLLTMKEAVSRYIRDGQSILISGFSINQGYAFAHEIIRQKVKDLTLMRSSGDILADQMIGAGCLRRVISPYVWNPTGPSSAYCFRRSIEKGIPHRIELEEFSFGSFCMAIYAAAHGLPFMPTYPLEGTGIFEHRPVLGPDKVRVIESPFSGEKVCLVKPLIPDVCLVHVQRADPEGNAQMWGPLGDVRGTANAGKAIVVSAEEIVHEAAILKEPYKTIIPGFRVAAVVHEPWGAHPSDVFEHYYRDIWFQAAYAEASKTLEGFQKFMEEWVFGVESRVGYLEKLGTKKQEELRWRKEE
jgi:glutaconate CoA-transferase subunit A